MPVWAPQRERYILNVMDFGANPNDTGTGADNVTAINAAIAALPRTSPIRGGQLNFPPGVYRINAGLTFPGDEDGIHIKFLGNAGATSTNGDFGSRLKAMTGSITMMGFIGAAVSQGGPVFEDFGLDGGGQSSVTGVTVQKVNKLQARNLTVSRCATGLQIDSLVDVSGSNDSSWHYLDGCEFYNNTTAINARHTYGFMMNGGKISQTGGTAINIGTVGSVIASQHVQIFGTKIDGAATGIACAGGHNHFGSMGFEGCTVGVAITSAGGGGITGNFNSVSNCAFSNGTSAVTIGSGCAANTVGPNSTSSVTNEWLPADATAARLNTFIQAYSGTGAFPGNLSLGTLRTTHPNDADLRASQGVWSWVDTNGAPTMQWKGKSANGTAVTGPLVLTGAGTPEAAVTAPIGALFLRTDGGATTTLYVKTSGAGNTGWTAK